MQTHWFSTVWPFIGMGAAIVMIAIMLLPDAFHAAAPMRVVKRVVIRPPVFSFN